MILRTPEYYSDFHCMADACPRNCCVGWEVVMDEETEARYRTVPDPMGRRLRGALRVDEEGKRCMTRQGGRCPFLDERNLCEVYMALGPEYTGKVCRMHPRFTEEYGCLKEISLSASCPEVARLLLSRKTPLLFPEREVREPETKPDEWLGPLLTCRKRELEILQNRALPWRTRAAWFLLLANEMQILLDNGNLDEMDSLCESCAELPPELPEEVIAPGEGLFPAALRILEGMEILEADWLPLLRAAERPTGVRLPDWALERISCYFVFRYFLRTVNDGDLLSRAEFAVFGTLSTERLAGYTMTAEAALYRFCREVEHDAENLETLRTNFCNSPSAGLARFFEELRKG